MGICTPSPNIDQSGIKKVIHVSVFIYKPPLVSREDRDNKNLTQVKTYSKTGKTNETNNHGYPNSPNMPLFNEYLIIVYKFLLPTQEDVLNMPHDKIPGKMGRTVNLTNTGRPIHPRWKSLLNRILLVAHYL